MLRKITNACVQVVNRWMPDPFILTLLLTVIVFVGAGFATRMGPIALIQAWGGNEGFWGLLSFSMQMALVLVLGSAMAAAPVCKRLLGSLAGLAKTNKSAILLTTIVSLAANWINWGFGLVVGALFAREVARRVRSVDYRLLIASAYSGFLIWHCGLSGSIPLALTEGTTFEGVLYQCPMTESTMSLPNILIILVLAVSLPLLNLAMHPDGEHTVTVDPELLTEPEEVKREVNTPADKLEHSRILWGLAVLLGAVFVVGYFVRQTKAGVSVGSSLTLNLVNFIFLFLGILLHGDLHRYIKAVGEAASSASGILLQFPFYAGIMGLMAVEGASGASLSGVISGFFVSISNEHTFPVFTFLSAGLVNLFVPSGGGQWAVQGPIVMAAARELGVSTGISAAALSWGDAWTNMIQPFWALPALGIAKLSAKDIMGYLVIVLLLSGVIVGGGLLIWSFLI